MKTLSQHFDEMINDMNKNITQEELDQAYLKLCEFNTISHKGGKIVENNDITQCEDEIRQFTLKNKIYKVCVREIKKQNNIKYQIINFYSPESECVLLQIKFNEKKAHLIELIKQEGCLMEQKNKNNYENIPKETGELLMEIIIKICEKFEITELSLTDNSYIICKNDGNKRINLIYSKMMLDGETWYSKFGFEPKDQIDKIIYKKNQQIYNKIMTYNIKKEYFVKKILDKEKNNDNITKILNKYDEMKNDKLSIFMKWISKNFCNIYCEIYEYIYEKAGYSKYSTLQFILYFNTNLTEFVKMVKNIKI